VGYTYKVGRNGGAIADILRREIPGLIEDCEAEDTEAIWHRVWWGLHYGGRGGAVVLALSALDIALWDLKARRANLPLFRLLGGFDARVPCYAGGIDLDLSVEALLKQTDDNLTKGFRAIKMKVGRSCIRRCTCPGDAQTSRRRLSADGRCQYEMDSGGSDPRGPGAATFRPRLEASKSRQREKVASSQGTGSQSGYGPNVD
jgi:L-alanine-DL-glutamate epimerase-like enolase superfamily enzyme